MCECVSVEYIFCSVKCVIVLFLRCLVRSLSLYKCKNMCCATTYSIPTSQHVCTVTGKAVLAWCLPNEMQNGPCNGCNELRKTEPPTEGNICCNVFCKTKEGRIESANLFLYCSVSKDPMHPWCKGKYTYREYKHLVPGKCSYGPCESCYTSRSDDGFDFRADDFKRPRGFDFCACGCGQPPQIRLQCTSCNLHCASLSCFATTNSDGEKGTCKRCFITVSRLPVGPLLTSTGVPIEADDDFNTICCCPCKRLSNIEQPQCKECQGYMAWPACGVDGVCKSCYVPPIASTHTKDVSEDDSSEYSSNKSKRRKRLSKKEQNAVIAKRLATREPLSSSPQRRLIREQVMNNLEKQGVKWQHDRNKTTSLTTPIGKCVLVPVPEVDRSNCDGKAVPFVIVEELKRARCPIYRLAMDAGVLHVCLSANEFDVTDKDISFFHLEEAFANWKRLKVISLREASASRSLFGGQGKVKCTCLTDCKSNKCGCFKSNRLCNSNCHKGSSRCENCGSVGV